MTTPHTGKATAALLLSLVSFAPACGSDSDVDTPTDADYQDIAQSVAPLIRAELASDGGAMLSAQVAMGHGPKWLSLEANGQAGGSAGDLKWSISASCAGASSGAGVCDETASSAMVSSIFEGKLALPNYSADLAAELNWSISGLQGDTLIAKGQTSIDAATEFRGFLHPVTRSFELAFDANYDLSIPRANAAQAVGKLEANIDAHRRVVGTNNNDRDAHFVVGALVTFDGSGTAIVTLDGNASFNLDLSSGKLAVRVGP